jgi:asparagine synthase (glutamine-hydrolysing)
VQRYWALSVDGEIRYRRGGEYVEHFADLLGQAVGDRLRCRSVGVLMSGGLDSTAIAATAKRCLDQNRAPYDLRAYTTVCHRIVPDPERRFAQRAADALSIPIHYRIVDDYRLFERWDKPELRRPEPESDPLLAVHFDQLNEAAVNGRVLLTGYGADPAMRLPMRYASELLRRGRIGRLAAEVVRYVAHCRRLPRVRLGRHARRRLGLERPALEVAPVWLGPAIRTRDQAVPESRPVHRTRPDAYELFESFDPGLTGVPVEVRHPFFDVRLVEYLLAIPPMPWCFDKTVVRLAMRGALPDAIRLRPKSVAGGDPVLAMLRSPDAHWIDGFDAVPALGRFVDRALVPPVRHEADANAVWTNLRPLCLNLWLQAHDAG